MASCYEGSAQEAYDAYQAIGRKRHGKPPDVVVGPTNPSFGCWVETYWQAGYTSLIRWINACDEVARELLKERNRARNAQFATLPMADIPPEQLRSLEKELARDGRDRRIDVGSLRELPSYGPSLLAIWTEAKNQGLANAEAALYVHRWATAWCPCWDRDAERKAKKLPRIDPKVTRLLRRVTAWRQTGNLEIPWDAQGSGQLWQVRLNDFPRAYMYTLIIAGEVIGDFNNWPDAWDRGEQKPGVCAEAAPVAPRPAIQVDPSTLISRYRSGEREAVWRDLVELGADVRQEPYHDAAWAVAGETMRRSARNVELLLARLKDLGYRFINPTEVHRTLNAKEGKLVERAERSGLWLPLSVRAWLQEVGQLNLNGSHPALCFMDTERGKPGIYTDPLQVLIWQLDDLVDMWTQTEKESREPMECIASMTAEDKALRALDEEAEGGYRFTIPNGAADAVLEGEPHNFTFVEYLRHSFQWGGFPGWEKYQNRPEEELTLLREGLLPI